MYAASYVVLTRFAIEGGGVVSFTVIVLSSVDATVPSELTRYALYV